MAHPAYIVEERPVQNYARRPLPVEQIVSAYQNRPTGVLTMRADFIEFLREQAAATGNVQLEQVLAEVSRSGFRLPLDVNTEHGTLEVRASEALAAVEAIISTPVAQATARNVTLRASYGATSGINSAVAAARSVYNAILKTSPTETEAWQKRILRLNETPPYQPKFTNIYVSDDELLLGP